MSSQADNTQKSASDIAAKDVIDTHGSGEPSADNVDVSSSTSGHDYSDVAPNEEQADNTQKGASDIAAKDVIDTHGSGEPSADNVDVST